MEAVTLYSTWPDAKSAQAAALALVEQRLIACANILPGAASVFRWRGAIETAEEAVMFAKTSAGAAEAAREAMIRLHPYETPCVVALRLHAEISSPAFLAWIGSETSHPT